jgi:hypothetical protein
MTTLSALVNELETKIEHSEKLDNAVSNASVGWHVQHSLLVVLGIIQAVEKSNPAEYVYKFNLKKTFVFTLNKIPRGKSKAPERVMPKEALNSDELKNEIQILKSRLDVLNTLQPGNFFIHPIFGHLNLKATIKMLKIHTKHHIDIINDIIKR